MTGEPIIKFTFAVDDPELDDESQYGEGIPPLSSALNDVEAMQRVLQNPSLGGFEQVERLLNPI